MQEWYLLTPSTRPNATGGYENQSFTDFKNDAFQEALETDIATTVLLYNYDLSECKEIRCIVQGNTADTQLKSMERTILTSIGTLKAGMYLYFEDRYWLVHGYPGNNKIYEKATVILCQYQLRWQSESGEIVERWANIVSASKYDTGTFGNQTIMLASNNFTILIPEDDLSATLEDKRVFIDRDRKNPHKVFKMTRSDDVLYLYGNHGGILSFIADRDEFNEAVDRPDLGLCDYIQEKSSQIPENPDETLDLFAEIVGSNTLKIGLNRTYSVVFKDQCGDIVNDVDFEWCVESDFEVNTDILSNRDIRIFVENDKSLIGKELKLKILIGETIISFMKIQVTGLY